MAVLTPGKLRGLATTSSPEGIFTILAVDHRDSLRAVMAPSDPAGVTSDALTHLKLDLIGGLAGDATGVMLEPEYSIPHAAAARVLPGAIGFLAAIEAQGYLGDPTSRMTSLLEGWGVEKAKRTGASGIKLLVLYHPEGGEVTDRQDALISEVIAECARHDIPLFLEPLAYSVVAGMDTGSAEFAATRRRVVIDTVSRLGALGPDVLKVQFPVDTNHESDRTVWQDACEELNAASPVPWALLSGGDPFDLFLEQVEIAGDAGASGFMVGRALWREAVEVQPERRQDVIAEICRPRFARLVEVATAHCRDWAARHEMPAVGDGWYHSY